MGKRKTQRKNAPMLDSDDDTSSVSSSSTMRSDLMSVLDNADEVELNKDSLLDEALEALYEKRSTTREKALGVIIDAFNSNLQYEFVEKKFATSLHLCLNCIKKGSSKEISLASHTIGLLALTVGSGSNAREIFEESIAPISQALKSGSESSKIVSLLGCLAIITFIGANPEETEKSMEIMWQVVHPKLGSNVIGFKPSAAVITAVVSAWSFLLTSLDGWRLSPKLWQESMTYFSGLLDKDDRSIRIAAGEALGVIFEMGSLEKFAAEARGSSEGSASEGNKFKEGFSHIQGLRAKILNQIRDLSVEAGGKGSTKKDLNNQRNLFKDVLEFLEYGYSPETLTKIGGDSLQTSTWSHLIQLNFLKHFLGGGFIKHMQENEFLQDVLGFVPKRKNPLGRERMSNIEKRFYKSPNSVLNKARTQHLNKQRMQSKSRNFGLFAADVEDNDV